MALAYSYTRFSTPEQAEGDSYARQIRKAKEYADAHGLVLDERLSYHDAGVSAFHGSNAEVGKLGEFLQAVHLGIVPKGSYLLIENLDRLSRNNIVEAQMLFLNLITNGINIVTVDDGKQYSREIINNNQFLIFEAIFSLIRANNESATKSKRLQAAWISKRADIKRKPLTGRVPEWLRLVGNAIEIIPERSAIVSRIFSEYLEGRGTEITAKKLNFEGIEPWGRGKQKAIHWHKSYINKILNNPAVYGEYTTHTLVRVDGKKQRVPQETISNYFPVVVPYETFARAKELRQSKMFAGRKTSSTLKNVFSGIAKCTRCGATVIRAGKGDYDYLVCGSAKAGKCLYNALRYDKIESKFLNIIRRAVVDMPNEDKIHNKYLDEIRKLRRQHTQVEKALQNLLKVIEDGEAPKGILERIRILEISKSELESSIKRKATEARTLRPTNVLHQRKSLVAVLEKAELDRSRCNALLAELCSSIVLHSLESIEVNFKNGAVLDMNLGEGKPYGFREECV